ncbi:MAG: hypothetical protein R2873_07410 [Caldilineaceae bacterium]|nr:response regulator transcription factor [Caldilineaceae bacterium]
MANQWSNVTQGLHRTHWSDPLASASILWLRARSEASERVVAVQKAIKLQGLKLHVADLFEVSSSQLTEADLILLDGFDRLDGTIETVLTRIRMENRVPLVILTNGYSTDQLVTALTAGADAIWAASIPVEVLLARCKAILRRASNTQSHR